jgi:DNA-binding response OmpR family regulator
MKILLAEDTEADALLYTDYLTKKGHEVDTCDRREQALKLLGEKDYDVAVIDLVLVASTGDSVIQAASTAGLGVVAMSASECSMDDLRLSLEMMGFKVHASLKKPFSLRMLLTAIDYAYKERRGFPAPPTPPAQLPPPEEAKS